MLLRGHFIIARAQQSFKYPDTAYVDVVDLESGRPFQFSTKAMHSEQINNFGKIPLLVDAEVELRPSQGGNGVYVVANRLQLRPIAEAEAETPPGKK